MYQNLFNNPDNSNIDEKKGNKENQKNFLTALETL